MIKNKVLFLTILLTINLATASPIYYNINLNSSEQGLKINTIDIELNQLEPTNFYNPSFNTQTLEIIDFNNKVLQTISFTIPDFQVYDVIDKDTGEIYTGGTETLTTNNFNILIPYNEKAKELIVYNNDKKELIRTSLAHFSKDTNAINYLEQTPPTSEKKIQKQPTKQLSESSSLWLILLIILIVLILILIILMKPNKK